MFLFCCLLLLLLLLPYGAKRLGKTSNKRNVTCSHKKSPAVSDGCFRQRTNTQYFIISDLQAPLASRNITNIPHRTILAASARDARRKHEKHRGETVVEIVIRLVKDFTMQRTKEQNTIVWNFLRLSLFSSEKTSNKRNVTCSHKKSPAVSDGCIRQRTNTQYFIISEVRRALLSEVSKSPQLEANHLCSHALLGTSYEGCDVISPRCLLRRSLASISGVWIFCEEKYNFLGIDRGMEMEESRRRKREKERKFTAIGTKKEKKTSPRFVFFPPGSLAFAGAAGRFLT